MFDCAHAHGGSLNNSVTSSAASWKIGYFRHFDVPGCLVWMPLELLYIKDIECIYLR